jgi:hypothetical protein
MLLAGQAVSHVLQLAPGGVSGGEQVRRALVAQKAQCILVAALLDVTVCGEVFGGGGAFDQVIAGGEGQGSRVVASREVRLREGEGIFIPVCD